MDRLTIKSKSLTGKHYSLKCMVNEDYDPTYASPEEYSCNDFCEITHPDACLKCGIQAAFDRLAAYEDTGLTPAEIEQMKAENARLHKLVERDER